MNPATGEIDEYDFRILLGYGFIGLVGLLMQLGSAAPATRPRRRRSDAGRPLPQWLVHERVQRHFGRRPLGRSRADYSA
jgi:hypothetical protein